MTEPVIIPAILESDVVYKTQPMLYVCEPCLDCQGTGQGSELSNSINPSKPWKDKKCPPCDGKGWHTRFISFSNLLDLFEPILFERFMNDLPEIIQQGKMAIIESVMNA